MHATTEFKSESAVCDMLGRILYSFGEEHRRNLNEITYLPAQKADAQRLHKEYLTLVEALARLKSKLGATPHDEVPSLDEALLDALVTHVAQTKRIAVKLIAESRTLSRPFWHVLRENCTYLEMAVGEVRNLCRQDGAPSLPTLEDLAEPASPNSLRATLDELLEGETFSAADVRRYDLDFEHLSHFSLPVKATRPFGLAGGIAKTIAGHVMSSAASKAGHIYLDGFKTFVTPFAVMVGALRETLSLSRDNALPEVFAEMETSDGLPSCHKIHFAPLLRNCGLLLETLKELPDELPHERVAVALFAPACCYLREIHLTLNFCAQHRMVDKPVFTPEVVIARRVCVDLLKDLGKQITTAEIRAT